MASWVDSLLHTFMQVFHYSVEGKKKKKTKNKYQKTKQHKTKKKIGPGV